MPSIELKPCPFCGGRADEYEGMYGNGIYCMRCGVMMGEPIHKEFRIEKRVSYEEAAEAWNTRAERTCRIVKTWSDSDFVDGWRYRCSECMCFIPVNERDPETGDVISAANYCPNCGARVVG